MYQITYEWKTSENVMSGPRYECVNSSFIYITFFGVTNYFAPLHFIKAADFPANPFSSRINNFNSKSE